MAGVTTTKRRPTTVELGTFLSTWFVMPTDQVQESLVGLVDEIFLWRQTHEGAGQHEIAYMAKCLYATWVCDLPDGVADWEHIGPAVRERFSALARTALKAAPEGIELGGSERSSQDQATVQERLNEMGSWLETERSGELQAEAEVSIAPSERPERATWTTSPALRDAVGRIADALTACNLSLSTLTSILIEEVAVAAQEPEAERAQERIYNIGPGAVLLQDADGHEAGYILLAGQTLTCEKGKWQRARLIPRPGTYDRQREPSLVRTDL